MSKKIEFLNKNNKRTHVKKTRKSRSIIDMGKKTSSGSKTQKKEPTKSTKSTTLPAKRRGRRPKKILETTENKAEIIPPEANSDQNNAVILGLRIDPSILKKINKNTATNNLDVAAKKSNSADQIDESSEGMFKNDIPGDSSCHKCEKNEKTITLLRNKLDKYEKKDKLDKSNKVYINKINFISYTSGKKMVIKKTNIKCWWDSNEFTNLPCFLPELFHNGTYHVTGCFCSFNCALAYNLYYIKDSKIHQRKSLIYKLYREMHGLNADDPIDIKESPPREILEDFGGDMSISVFRRSFVMINKEYLVFIPPIKPINVMTEERNVDLTDEDNDKKYVLKRSKPLTKKRSVISSMKIKMEQEQNDE